MNVQFATPVAPIMVLPDRRMMLEGLSVLRQEWEGRADGDSLIDLSGSVGLMLFDVTALLGLTPEEQTAVLGDRLYQEAIVKTQGESVL
jgi:hypothetical protein